MHRQIRQIINQQPINPQPRPRNPQHRKSLILLQQPLYEFQDFDTLGGIVEKGQRISCEAGDICCREAECAGYCGDGDGQEAGDGIGHRDDGDAGEGVADRGCDDGDGGCGDGDGDGGWEAGYAGDGVGGAEAVDYGGCEEDGDGAEGGGEECG